MPTSLKSEPGTYALILGLSEPVDLLVGRLGVMTFGNQYYMYCGSAFGPGGLRARISHHLRHTEKPHWHIDYLRQYAEVVDIWFSLDSERLECRFQTAACALDGAASVAGFGSTDCGCISHLVGFKEIPELSAFQQSLAKQSRSAVVERAWHDRSSGGQE